MPNNFTRRNFIQTAAGAAGLALATKAIALPEPAYMQQWASGTSGQLVQFGIIGIGMQGSGLLKNLLELPGTKCIAACDLWDGRQTLAREIVGSDIMITRKYQELLADKDIQALIVAVPDHWHRQIVVDAVTAGKDVYCEKPMSHNVADGAAMVAAAKKSGRIVQIGSQRTSSALLAKAKQLYDQGAIGELLSVELSLGRNDPTGAWEYPPPPGLSTENFDWDTWLGTAPKKPFDPITYARWRCWKEYGTGVAGDLMVHLVSGMMFVAGINKAPSRAYATGGIVRWKDGRNMPDLQAAIFEYGSVPVYVRLTLGTETAEMTRLMGPKGLLEIRERDFTYTPQRGIDTAPSYYDQGFPKAMRTTYETDWHKEHDAAPGHEFIAEAITYSGPSYDDEQPHLWNFFEAVRTRKPVVQDAVFGHHAAAACHMANQAYFQKSVVTWDEATSTIHSA
jgi:predicted dehydrogenase